MSKAVILAVNAKYVHSSLSAWVLAGGISKYARIPHKVSVVESTINQDCNDIADKVAVYLPEIIAISAYIWNAGMLPGLIKLLRKRLPEAVFVLGGPEASHNALNWLANGADFVLRGEGERSLPALLDALGNKSDTGHVPGLVSKTQDNSQAEQLNDFIDPYNEAYFVALGGRISYLETSRGCPFHCDFCLSRGSRVRFLSLEDAKDRLNKL